MCCLALRCTQGAFTRALTVCFQRSICCSGVQHHNKKNYHMANQLEEYVTSAVQMFLVDPPDTDFQYGFLAALLVVAKEALELRMDNPPFANAQDLWRS